MEPFVKDDAVALLPIEREDFPNLKRWYDALTERAGYQEHIMNPMV